MPQLPQTAALLLPVFHIGLLRNTVPITHGIGISQMAGSTATLRTKRSGFVLSGLFSYLTIQHFKGVQAASLNQS